MPDLSELGAFVRLPRPICHAIKVHFERQGVLSSPCQIASEHLVDAASVHRSKEDSMPTPRYRLEQFVPSGWDSGTPERKAKFVNALLRFIAEEFPSERFTRALYLGLSNHGYFRFIAHYDIHGFYAEQLSTPERQARFLRELAEICQHDARLDRPDLWTDVKAVLAKHLLVEPPEPGATRLRPFRSLAPRPAPGGRDTPTLF